MKPNVQKVEPAEKMPKASAEKESAREASGLHPLVALREEVDQLFDHFFSNFSLGPFGRQSSKAEPIRRLEEAFYGFRPLTWGTVPRADVSETDGKYKVEVELPGMKEEDLDITISRGMLTIKGEKSVEERKEGEDFLVSERRYGSVLRTFPIPETVDTDKVEASFEDGVLTIEMKKGKLPKPEIKKIAIKS